MYIQLELLFTLILPIIKCDFHDHDDEMISKNSKNQRNLDRFQQDLDDYEFHIAHLKYVEFDGRRTCLSETFEDRARRYRRTLRNDGSLVKFVSAQPLPFNESDLYEDRCKVENDNVTKTEWNKQAIKDDNATVTNNVTVSNNLTVSNNITVSNDTTFSVNNTVTRLIKDYKATTPDIKGKGVGSAESREDPSGKGSRRSEYIFSSVEYYDEVPEFDPSTCPEAMEMIELEIDELRKYDVECENMIEWRSLNSLEP